MRGGSKHAWLGPSVRACVRACVSAWINVAEQPPQVKHAPPPVPALVSMILLAFLHDEFDGYAEYAEYWLLFMSESLPCKESDFLHVFRP